MCFVFTLQVYNLTLTLADRLTSVYMFIVCAIKLCGDLSCIRRTCPDNPSGGEFIKLGSLLKVWTCTTLLIRTLNL